MKTLTYRAQILCANALILSKFLVLNLIKIGENWSLNYCTYFFYRNLLKFKFIHEASFVSKPKSSNILPQKKNFVEPVRKQYGNPDSFDLFEIICNGQIINKAQFNFKTEFIQNY